MGTVPTGKLERELRALYLRWLANLSYEADNLPHHIDMFRQDSEWLIRKLGGQTASLGALADFPVPKLLELSPRAGVIYDEMKQAAIQAGIAAGLQASDVARQMVNAGLDKSFRKLNRLARTETVSAYWKNQWDSVAGLPAIVMVWGSEESKRTCDYCLSRDGLVVEDPNIRDHPNGRCTLIPTLRSQVKYKGTLQPDGSVTMDPRWADQKVKGAKAQVSAGDTTEEQRDPTSGKSNPAAPSRAQAQQASASRPVATTESQAPVFRQADHKTVRTAQQSYYEKLTAKQRESINMYVGKEYEPINSVLRGGKFDPGYEGTIGAAKARSYANDLAATVRNAPPLEEDIIVYRGQAMRGLGGHPKNLSGQSWTQDGFLSTSAKYVDGEELANAFANADVQMEILLPKGSQAMAIGAGEGEILLPPGSRFNIVEVVEEPPVERYASSKWRLKMVLVGQ